MPARLMILPSEVFEQIRVLSIPEDFEEHEVYRHITGLIATVQESNPDCSWEDVAEVLEDHGFAPVDCILGPELLCRKAPS